jgi:site-specific DNA-methyltransferase (adenine-specific)
LNIDGSRIEASDQAVLDAAVARMSGNEVRGDLNFAGQTSIKPNSAQGRWPANVILDELTAGLLDEQSGVSVSKSVIADRPGKDSGVLGSFAGQNSVSMGHNDTGGASRFFYVAKASKRDRNEGLEDLEAKSAAEMTGRKEGSAGLVMKHVDGSDKANAYAGTTGSARQNFHPTVKPTALMRYLIKLVTPPGGTVLDPFTGSGSTGKAALLDGFQFVGVELTEEYLPIIEGRLRWASEQVEDDDTLF